MDVLAHGTDTLRVRYIAAGLPTYDPAYRDEMVEAGWKYHQAVHNDGDARIESHNYAWQDPDNPSRRYYLQGGAGYVHAEASIPRLVDDSEVNLNLADADQAAEVMRDHAARLESMLQIPVIQDRITRADLAVDIAAGSARPGVISATQQIQLPARKITRHIYPGETSMVRAPQMAFRGYDKAAEMVAKLSVEARAKHADLLQLTRDQGRTRLEFQLKPRGGLPDNILTVAPRYLADLIDSGFPNGVVQVGGLEAIRQHVDALEVAPQTRNALIAFAVRYAQLGEDGMKDAYSRASFYRHKRRFLEYGLRLDDVCAWAGVVDFESVAGQLRIAA